MGNKGWYLGEGMGLRRSGDHTERKGSWGRDGMVGKHHKRIDAAWGWGWEGTTPPSHHGKGMVLWWWNTMEKGLCLRMGTRDPVERPPPGTGAAAETQMRKNLPGTAFYFSLRQSQ